MDDGTGTERIIQSGLRPYLTEDELLGQHVIIAANLAPRKMKGVEIRGMLLVCEYTGEKPAKIDIDKFCKFEYCVSRKCFTIAGKPVTTSKADNCEVC